MLARWASLSSARRSHSRAVVCVRPSATGRARSSPRAAAQSGAKKWRERRPMASQVQRKKRVHFPRCISGEKYNDTTSTPPPPLPDCSAANNSNGMSAPASAALALPSPTASETSDYQRSTPSPRNNDDPGEREIGAKKEREPHSDHMVLFI